MVSGIYIIKNKVNGKFYVGSSCNCEERFSAHKILLRKGKHHSVVLQRAWNKYGERNFIFKVIEECCAERLLDREQFYIDNFNPHYNTNPFADKPPTQWGFNHPMSNLTKKELNDIRVRLMEGASARSVARELGVGHRQVLQIAHKNSYPNEPGPKGWDTWQYEGGKHRVSNNRLDENKVMEIRERLMKGELVKDLAAEYDVYLTAVNKIAQGKTWKGVMPNGFKEWRDARKRR